MIERCRLCEASTLHFVFDLGVLPLGFPVALEEARSEKLWRERLVIHLCEQCGLAQTGRNVPPEQLITENLYASSVAQVVRTHDEKFVREVVQQLGLRKDTLILEIGCGDGVLLRCFHRWGFNNLIGIEPAIHPSVVYPFPVIRSFFNAQVVQRLIHDGKQPDLLICNYVLELVPEIRNFFANLRNVMKDGSYLVVEVPYFLDSVRNRRVDGFVHLRCLWFTLTALVYAFQHHGLEVVTIEYDEVYRGGTLRAVCRKVAFSTSLSEGIQRRLEEERAFLFGKQLGSLQSELKGLRRNLQEHLDALVKSGIAVYGYGAGLKACTLLNWLNLDHDSIVMVVDRDPNKQGKAVPIVSIPIGSPDKLPSTVPVAVLMLALDHITEVERFLRSHLAPGSQIVHLLPCFRTGIIGGSV